MYIRRITVTTLNDKVYNALIYLINTIDKNCIKRISGRSVKDIGNDAIRTFLEEYRHTAHYNALYERLLNITDIEIMTLWKNYLKNLNFIGGLEYLCKEINLSESETSEFINMYIEMKINENTPKKSNTLEERLALLERKVEHLENFPGIKFDDISSNLIKKVVSATVVGTNRKYRSLQDLFIGENIRSTEKSSTDLVRILNSFIVKSSGEFIHFNNYGVKIGLVVR